MKKIKIIQKQKIFLEIVKYIAVNEYECEMC